MLYLAGDYPLGSLAFILIYSFSSYCALLTAWSLRQRTLRHATLPVRFPIPDKSGDDRLLSVCFGPPFPIKFADCVDTFTYCFLKTAFQRNRARIYCLTRPGLWAHVYCHTGDERSERRKADSTRPQYHKPVYRRLWPGETVRKTVSSIYGSENVLFHPVRSVGEDGTALR